MAIEDIKRSNAEKATKRQEIISEIEKTIRKAMQDLALTGLFSECKCSPVFFFAEDAHDKTLAYKSLLFHLPTDLHKGFPGGFYLLFRFSTDESGFIEISSIGFFLGAFVNITVEMPHQIIKQIVKPQPYLRNINRLQAPELSPLPNLQITFSGSFSKGIDILDFLKIKIVGLIYKAVSDVQPDVQSLLSFHENRAMGISKTFVSSGPPRIYHCDLD